MTNDVTESKPAHQKQNKSHKEVKAEKRAAALRDNLKRRKEFIKETKSADTLIKDQQE